MKPSASENQFLDIINHEKSSKKMKKSSSKMTVSSSTKILDNVAKKIQ
jgi:hypothetical protein